MSEGPDEGRAEKRPARPTDAPPRASAASRRRDPQLATSTTDIGCPHCGDREPLPIVYGLATFAVFQASERGEFALGGCVIERTSPDWRCRRCGHEWADGMIRSRIEASFGAPIHDLRGPAES